MTDHTSDGQYGGGDGRPVLVAGSAGQLGRTIVDLFGRELPTVGLDRRQLDVTRAADVLEAARAHRPWAIVNCAAYNQVDQAESEPEAAFAVNALAVRNLARAAEASGAALVHYSSDFVFDGEADRPYRETDAARPQSVYAASKLVGEWFAEGAPRHYVLRVESLFGGTGRMTGSFDKIIDAVARGGSVRVFSDRVVSPSYAIDIARATLHLLRGTAPSGLYHCVNGGFATWAELAEVARERMGSSATLEKVLLRDVPLVALRPRYCALANDKLTATGFTMPAWQDALDRYLRARGLIASPQRT